MSDHELLSEAYERLEAGDVYRRDRGEYTYAEVLSALLLLLREAREQIAFEHDLLSAVLREHEGRRRHLRVAA
jgi:hypothetical protein